ncbi:UNVERIFIED_CONTAM: Retrovirus-related Pol polyprotein from transposon RE1 [Sesamum latifolium]|uniref:Retrovirus-related Pol polyprotein from transposon RE1 n=1 Tax=Sesamum latifolium TaxID=2727402 RepID=A0AAW2X8R5_9LAMI
MRAYGSIDKYKARLVAKGYNQVEAIDFVDSFLPVAKPVTARILLAIAASKNWYLHQLDINNAFLHGYLEEEIYMQAHEGYLVPPGSVCKLKRSLYGLKQVSRQWNMEFKSKPADCGFSQSQHDHFLFTTNTSTDLMGLLVYVNDVLIAGASEELILEVKAYLDSLFTIEDIGVAKYFLGLEIARSSQGIPVIQSKYVKDMLTDVGLLGAKSATTPLPIGIKFTSEAGHMLSNPEPYRRLVRKLLYLGFTPPDISHAIQQLSQYLKQPYLVAYCDVDWGSCIDSRKSLTGYCIFLGSALISWKTKKRNTVSRSTVEAEYRSTGSTACELTWACNLLLDFQLRDKYKAGFLLPKHVPSKLQLADAFTKALTSPTFLKILPKVGFGRHATNSNMRGGGDLKNYNINEFLQ